MQSVDPAETLLSLLNGPKASTGRTVLLSGAWGSGKTYLWKERVAGKLKRPYVYVSAFGAESALEFKSRVLSQFARCLAEHDTPFWKEKDAIARVWDGASDRVKQVGKAVGSVLSSVAGAIAGRNQVDVLALAGVLPPEAVICIDDVERISGAFKVTELLGMANILSEQKQFDVVLICNEQQIGGGSEEELESFKKYKEKVVSVQLHVQSDATTVFDRLAEAVLSNPDDRAVVARNKAIILDAIERSKVDNLRIMARAFSHLATLRAAGFRALTEGEVRFLAAVTIELATHPKTTREVLDFNAFAERLIASMDTRTKQTSPLSAERARFLETYVGDGEYQFHSGIFDLVQSGRLDADAFAVPKEPELTEAGRLLKAFAGDDWRYWNDARTRQTLVEVTRLVTEGKSGTARQTLECLTIVRILNNMLRTQAPPEVTDAAIKTLQKAASANDTSLGSTLGVHEGAEYSLARSEFNVFKKAQKAAHRQHLVETLRGAVMVGDWKLVLSKFGENGIPALEALTIDVGADSVLELRSRHPQAFSMITIGLYKSAQEWSEVPEPLANGLLEVAKRLAALMEDEREESATRWRISNLIRDRVEPWVQHETQRAAAKQAAAKQATARPVAEEAVRPGGEDGDEEPADPS